MRATAIILFLTVSAGPQCIGQIKLDEIRSMTNDSSSKYFYDTLLVHFLERPHEFEMTKSICIYYGKLFTPLYKPYHVSEAEAGFDEFVRRGNYQRAITLGERLLRDDPVNFGVLLKLMKCYFETGQQESAALTRMKAQILHKAILHSGNDDSESSAIQVINVADEYAIMGLMGTDPVNRKSQMKPSSIVDHWKVRAEKGGKRDLYFEVLLNRDDLRNKEVGNE